MSHKTRILVVDDDPDYLWMMQANLEARGYEVLTAGGGREALDLISTGGPDLVILDIQMPGMDGLTVCHCVREFSSVPIIIASARERAVAEKQSLRMGADSYLSKPFRLAELLAQVRALAAPAG
jgi:two-component system KDP operon response regulator KdpE